MDIRDVRRDNDSDAYQFGVDPLKVADKLRRLAAAIERGDACVKDVCMSEAAGLEAFAQHSLTVTYAPLQTLRL